MLLSEIQFCVRLSMKDGFPFKTYKADNNKLHPLYTTEEINRKVGHGLAHIDMSHVARKLGSLPASHKYTTDLNGDEKPGPGEDRDNRAGSAATNLPRGTVSLVSFQSQFQLCVSF